MYWHFPYKIKSFSHIKWTSIFFLDYMYKSPSFLVGIVESGCLSGDHTSKRKINCRISLQEVISTPLARGLLDYLEKIDGLFIV